MITSLDIHYYDGKLGPMQKCINKDINRVSKIPSISKSLAFEELEHFCIHYKISRDGLHCLRQIIQSHSQFGRCMNPVNPNYDPKNKMCACDLLYLVYEKICLAPRTTTKEKVKVKDYTSLLFMQMQDMKTGLCPQGRVTRLFQMLVMME